MLLGLKSYIEKYSGNWSVMQVMQVELEQSKSWRLDRYRASTKSWDELLENVLSVQSQRQIAIWSIYQRPVEAVGRDMFGLEPRKLGFRGQSFSPVQTPCQGNTF